MRFAKSIKVSIRCTGAQFRPDIGNKQYNYNYGYPQFCYHLKWNGPTNLTEEINRGRGAAVFGRNKAKFYREKVGEAAELFSKYTSESYDKSIGVLDELSVNKNQNDVLWQNYEVENDPIQYEKTLCPNFRNPAVRTLLYILQGVEANIDLASQKLYEFRDHQQQFNQVNYKVPGKHLMSEDQFDEYMSHFLSKLIEESEIPPIYIPRLAHEFEYKFKEETSNRLFKHVDGSNLVMIDTSAGIDHEDRQVVVREGITGKLRDAYTHERDRQIQFYYPSKYRSLDIPIYINVDHIENDDAISTLLTDHGWKGAVHVMEAAVAYYNLDDERYYRLRVKVNDLLIADDRFDDFYASRHFGQFMVHVIESSQISKRKIVDHLLLNRKDNVLRAELRAFIILLEIWNTHEDKSEEVMERIFTDAQFESRLLGEIYPMKVPVEVIDALNRL